VTGKGNDRLFIGGRWVVPSSSSRISVVSPSSEETIGSVPAAVEADIDAAVAAARDSFDDPAGWAHWSAADRADALRQFADALAARAHDVARQVTLQNGMPAIYAGPVEGHASAFLLRQYADLIEAAPLEEFRKRVDGAGKTLVLREPVGVVAAIPAWNYPQSLAAFKYAPALAAGCTVVIKPSPYTVLDAVILAEAVQQAGLPPGVVNIVPAESAASAHLVEHPGVDKVSFTGSTAVGRRIAESCGRRLRPVTLELGGKSAAIVLDDADLDGALTDGSLFNTTLTNSGQTCALSTRILAPRDRYDEVVDAVATMARSLVVGDPLDPSTQIGPVVSERQRARIESYIAEGRDDGARLVTGGGRPARPHRGWFLEPTVFADVDNRSALAQEEIFGPVLCVIAYTDQDDAIRIANDSAYGLAGSVWTRDRWRGVDVASRIRTGSVAINGRAADLGAPFGGVKDSGMGKERGPEGLYAYQNLKSVVF
jgi:acyl-CoA reductase-like NAD-dependent aldehyde dehydrogenase